jgi:tetratricopeptide (TPR) repeat protein
MMKALEKNRERRYQSALELAKDIRRWRSGEAIEARPPSLSYQVAVFARRNRVVVGAAASIVAALVIGLGVSTAMYFEARRAEARAEAQREKAVAATSFMQDMIFAADPVRIGDRIRVGDLLDGYSATLDRAFPGQPEVEAQVRTTIGRTYLNLYLFERDLKGEAYRESARQHLSAALELREGALGEEHPDTLASMDTLAGVLAGHGRLDEAEPLARRALEIRRRVLGPEHPESVEAMDALAQIFMKQERFEEAEPLAVEALETCESSVGPESEDALQPLRGLAELRLAQGRLAEGERLYRDLVERSVRIHGAEARYTRQVRGRLGGLMMEQGRVDEAAGIYGNKKLPGSFGIEEWLQGNLPAAGTDPTLLIFWEAWCPFSQRQVPEFEISSRPFREGGMKLVGFSRARDPEGKERLTEFLREKEISFPSALTGDDTWQYFDIAGTPSAAAIKDGRVVFEGYLSLVTEEFLTHLVEEGPVRAGG